MDEWMAAMLCGAVRLILLTKWGRQIEKKQEERKKTVIEIKKFSITEKR